MKKYDNINLDSNQNNALNKIKDWLFKAFKVESLVLYGSVARGDADKESDIDLLIITSERLPRVKRHRITDMVFDVNLRYDTNFSTLVVDRDSWEKGIFTVLPLREEIISEGIEI